jgi:quinol monooxygenase YgiN
MIHVVTYVDVEPGFTSSATALLRQYREQYRETTGAEVLQETSRQNRFVMIEAWNDESSFQAHENAEQTCQFRTKLKAIHNSPNDQRVHHDFSIGESSFESALGGLWVVTHVDVPPPRRDETEVLLKALSEESRKDPGNRRYDVFQQSSRPNHFTVCAVWNDEKAFASHQRQTHSRQFREALWPMLGAPYDERLYKIVPSPDGRTT